MKVRFPECTQIDIGEKRILLNPEDSRTLFKELAKLFLLRAEVKITQKGRISLRLYDGVYVTLTQSEALGLAKDLIETVQDEMNIPF